MTKKSTPELPEIIEAKEDKGFVFSEIKFSANPEELKQYANYLDLKIEGAQDKEGLKKCYDARQILKKIRIAVSKEKKELDDEVKEQSKQQLSAIASEYQKIVDLITPVETHLQLEEQRIEAEIEKAKKEKEAEEALKLSKRVEALLSLGFIFSGIFYKFITITNEIIQIEFVALKTMSDEEFKGIESNAKIEFDKLVAHREELARIAKEEEERRLAEAEAIRLENIRLKEEADKKLAEEREKAENELKERERVQKEQSDLQAKRLQEVLPYNGFGPDVNMPTLYQLPENEFNLTLSLKKSEFEKSEKERIEAEKKQNEEILAEKARLEAINKEQAEKQAKIDAELQAIEVEKQKIEASRVIALPSSRKPDDNSKLSETFTTPEERDFERILDYHNHLVSVSLPDFESERGLVIHKELSEAIEKFSKYLIGKSKSF